FGGGGRGGGGRGPGTAPPGWPGFSAPSAGRLWAGSSKKKRHPASTPPSRTYPPSWNGPPVVSSAGSAACSFACSLACSCAAAVRAAPSASAATTATAIQSDRVVLPMTGSLLSCAHEARRIDEYG